MSNVETNVAVKHLKELADLYFRDEDTNRASIFNTAAKTIEEAYPIALPEDIKVLGKLRGIGPSTITEVQQCIQTGTSKRLEELKVRITEEKESVTDSLNKLKSLLKRNNDSSKPS